MPKQNSNNLVKATPPGANAPAKPTMSSNKSIETVMIAALLITLTNKLILKKRFMESFLRK